MILSKSNDDGQLQNDRQTDRNVSFRRALSFIKVVPPDLSDLQYPTGSPNSLCVDESPVRSVKELFIV